MAAADLADPAGEQRLVSNAIASMANVAVGSVLVFLLYRLLLQKLGAEILGVWSVLIASVGAARLSELGMAAGATRFVATARAQGDARAAVNVSQTATLTLLFFGAVGAGIAQLLLPHVLGRFLQGAQLAAALGALPWVLAAFAIGLAAGAAQSALDGCQRVDLRVWVSLAGQLVLLAASLLLVEGHGLAGVAMAQLLQSLVVFVGSWLLLRGQLQGLPALPCRWSHATFRRILGYSALFQLNNLLLLLLDPLTKIMLARFGGLSATAYFDMANQLVQRLRLLPVAAVQVLVPAMAHAGTRGEERVRELYTRSYRAIFATTTPSFCLVAALVPVIGTVWIGHHEPLFTGMAWMCLAGWALSTMGTPAYYGNVGTGTLLPNTIGHAMTSSLSLACGWYGGIAWGAYGVAAGYIIGVVVGGLYVQAVFMRRLGFAGRMLVPDESRVLLLASLLAMVLCLGLDAVLIRILAPHGQHLIAQLLRIGLLAALFLAIVGFSAWSHPLRQSIADRLGGLVRRRPAIS